MSTRLERPLTLRAKETRSDAEIIASIDGFAELSSIANVLSKLGERGYVNAAWWTRTREWSWKSLNLGPYVLVFLCPFFVLWHRRRLFLPPESRVFTCKKMECKLITVYHEGRIAFLQKIPCDKHKNSCRFCLTHGHCNEVGQLITSAMSWNDLVWHKAALFEWESGKTAVHQGNLHWVSFVKLSIRTWIMRWYVHVCRWDGCRTECRWCNWR